MKLIVAKDYAAQCSAAADIIEKLVREKPQCRLGLATGSSPVGIYKELIRRHQQDGLDFSQVSSVNLDEYVGLEPEHEQSYRYFMNSQFFDHINIDKANTYVASGVGDPEESLKCFRTVLAKAETELQLLGLGGDGHVGFNEPGEALHCSAHMETLDERTIAANARFFESIDQVPRSALTMGIGDIMSAKSLLMIISGEGKEEAAKYLLMSDTVSPACPASFMKLHSNATVIISRELADKIGCK